MGNIIRLENDENNKQNIGYNQSIGIEGFQDKSVPIPPSLVQGYFHYKVNQGNSSNIYKYLVEINLNDTKENIVVSLNEQIGVNSPDSTSEVVGDFMSEQQDPEMKGYFKIVENDNIEKIVFVLPTKARSIVLIDDRDLESMGKHIPSIFPFLGMEIKEYRIRNTSEIEVSLSTNKDITLLKYEILKLENKLDEVKYSENLEKTRRALRIKELNSKVTSDNVSILEYSESWYPTYISYFKTLLIFVIVGMIVYYLLNSKKWDYYALATIFFFLIYCIFF
jgi:hypothetical protein